MDTEVNRRQVVKSCGIDPASEATDGFAVEQLQRGDMVVGQIDRGIVTDRRAVYLKGTFLNFRLVRVGVVAGQKEGACARFRNSLHPLNIGRDLKGDWTVLHDNDLSRTRSEAAADDRRAVPHIAGHKDAAAGDGEVHTVAHQEVRTRSRIESQAVDVGACQRAEEASGIGDVLARQPGGDIILGRRGKGDDVAQRAAGGVFGGKPDTGAVVHGGVSGVVGRRGTTAKQAGSAVGAGGADAVGRRLRPRRQDETHRAV